MWVTFNGKIRWVSIRSISATTDGLFIVLRNGKKILISKVQVEEKIL